MVTTDKCGEVVSATEGRENNLVTPGRAQPLNLHLPICISHF